MVTVTAVHDGAAAHDDVGDARGCYIVADLTEGLRKQLIGLPLQPTPDNEGMFGYTDNPKAFVEIIPFSKLLKDAKARNSAFFTRLGLNG